MWSACRASHSAEQRRKAGHAPAQRLGDRARCRGPKRRASAPSSANAPISSSAHAQPRLLPSGIGTQTSSARKSQKRTRSARDERLSGIIGSDGRMKGPPRHRPGWPWLISAVLAGAAALPPPTARGRARRRAWYAGAAGYRPGRRRPHAWVIAAGQSPVSAVDQVRASAGPAGVAWRLLRGSSHAAACWNVPSVLRIDALARRNRDRLAPEREGDQALGRPTRRRCRARWRCVTSVPRIPIVAVAGAIGDLAAANCGRSGR